MKKRNSATLQAEGSEVLDTRLGIALLNTGILPDHFDKASLTIFWFPRANKSLHYTVVY